MRIYLIQLLNEALGVPENMLPMAAQVYNTLGEAMASMPQRTKNTPLSLNDEFSTTLTGDFKVGNISFSEVEFQLNIEPDSSVNWLEPGGAAFAFGGYLDPKSGYKRLVTPKNTTVNLRIILRANENDLDMISWDDVADYIKVDGRTRIMTDLAHELKHAFDKNIEGERGEDIFSRMRYKIATDSIGFPPVDRFHYLYYYTSYVENLVRPTEFASELELGNVTKKDFLGTFQKSEVYKILQDAKNASYENLLSSIVDDERAMSVIKGALDRSNLNYSSWSDEEIAEFLLEHEYKKIKQKLKSAYLGFLVQDENNPFFSMFGVDVNRLESEKRKAYEEMSKKIDQFGDNFRAFYKNEANEIRRNAEKLYRKLAKLYAYIQ